MYRLEYQSLLHIFNSFLKKGFHYFCMGHFESINIRGGREEGSVRKGGGKGECGGVCRWFKCCVSVRVCVSV